jgi:tRNA A-37 threonylcarbamoyl transferase component Bud32
MPHNISSIVSLIPDFNKRANRARAAVWVGKPAKGPQRLLIYICDDSNNAWLAKVDCDSSSSLLNEYETLRNMPSHLRQTGFGEAIPKTVAFDENLLIQEWIQGKSLKNVILYTRHLPWRAMLIRRLCFSAVTWLASFHKLARISGGGKESRGAVHGDFTPSNILIRPGKKLGIVDWEISQPNEKQLFDLLHFATYLGMACRWKSAEEAFRDAFLEKTWVSGIIRNCLQRYAREACFDGIDWLAEYKDYLRARLLTRSKLNLENETHYLRMFQGLLAKYESIPYALATGGK